MFTRLSELEHGGIVEGHVTQPQNVSTGHTGMEKEDVTFSRAAAGKEDCSGEDSKVETTNAQ